MNKVDFLEKTLERQIGFVRASETRVSFTLPAMSLVLGIWLYGFKQAETDNVVAVLSGSLSLVGFIVLIYFVWLSMFPQTEGAKKSLIFFGSISNTSLEEYRELVLQQKEEDYMHDLIQQIHINSQIAMNKFSSVKSAMLFWYISLVPLTVFLVVSI